MVSHIATRTSVPTQGTMEGAASNTPDPPAHASPKPDLADTLWHSAGDHARIRPPGSRLYAPFQQTFAGQTAGGGS
jgi:hypothetical protein